MWELLRSNQRFRLLFFGTSLSTFGDTALYLTLPIWVKDLLDSNSAAGAVFFALGLASLADPLTGVLVDRMARRKILIWTNVLTGLVVSTLFAVRGPGQVWLIFVVTLLYGAALNVVGSARAGMLKDVVADERLGAANATLQTTSTSLRLLAPLAGAGLFALFGAWVVVLLDVVTFAAAVLCFCLIRLVETPPERDRDEPFLKEVTAGFAYARKSRIVFQMVGASAVAFLVLGLYESIPFAMIDGLGREPSLFGVLTSVQGVGAVAGGLVVARIIERLREPRTFGVGLTLMAGATALLLVQSLPVVLAGCVVMGLSLPMIAVSMATALQRYTPGRLLGRVSSAGELVIGGSQTVSVAIGAVLIASIDYRLLLVAIVVVLVPLACVLLLRPVRAESVGDEPERGELGREVPPRGEAPAGDTSPERDGPPVPSPQETA